MELKTKSVLESFENQISELQSQHQILSSLTERFNSFLNQHFDDITKALRKGGILASDDNISVKITKTGDFDNKKYTKDSKLVISVRGEMTGWLKPVPYDWSYTDRTASKRSQKAKKVIQKISETLPFEASVSCNEFSLQLSLGQESTIPMIDIYVK